MLTHRGVRGSVVVLAASASLLSAAPAVADSAPELRSARFAKPAVVGQAAMLQMRAVDKERTVSGAVVAFAGEGAYGTSACRPGGATASRAKPQRAASRSGPGKQVTLTVPHRFRTAGKRSMLVRLDSAGCSGGGGVLLQPFAVTPVEKGQAAQQPVPDGSPVSILGSLVGNAPPVPGNGDGNGNGNGNGGNSGVDLPPGVTDPIGSLPGVGSLPGLPPPPPEPTDPTEPLPDLPLPDPGEILPPPPKLPLAHAAAACRDADLVPTLRNQRRIRAATVCLVNAERRAHNLRPVRQNRRMNRAAAIHSFDMVARNYFSHSSPEGHTLVQRLIRSRWLPRPPGWSAGENIAFGETPLSTPRATVVGWMESTGHRENNLDPAWRLAGIGVVAAVPGAPNPGATYTAVFGK